VPPSRCVRCGAGTRDALCTACVRYLSGYHPLWLDPSLLPGPSILAAVAPHDEALLSIDPNADLEWREARDGDPATPAIAIVDTLGLGQGQVLLSEGDAERIHAFLSAMKTKSPRDPRHREASAALFRHIASIPSMPPHLADEYAARARSLTKPAPVAPPPVEPMPPAEMEMPAASETEEEAPPETVEAPATEAPEELPDAIEEAIEREVDLLAPEPEEPEPSPEESPHVPEEPEGLPGWTPEDAAAVEEAARRAQEAAARATDEAERITRIREEIERDKFEIDSWVQREAKRIEEHAAEILERERTVEEKASELREKEQEVVAKVSDLETKEREVREKIEWAEKDERRRAVMEVLDTVPGMTIPTAKVITNAFPDLDSLKTADVKALMQCQGVTDALAREIRALIAPDEKEVPLGYREQAHTMLEEGDIEGARRVLDDALRERPDDESLWVEKAELLILLNRPSEALHCYNRVLDLNRGNKVAWWAKANLLFAAGRYSDTMDCLHEVLQLDPAKAIEILLKAEQLRIGGQMNEAAFLFQSVLDTDPNNTRAILGLADCMQALGDTDASESLVTRALGRDPANPGALYRKGTLLNRKGRWGAALQLYNRAIALAWNYPDAWVGKGEIHLKRGRNKEALEAFTKALEFANARIDAWLGKAQAHWALGDKESAKASLDRAIQIDPDSREVKWVAELFKGAEAEPWGELPAEFKAFIEAVEPEAEDAATLGLLAEMALEGGDPEMAILRYDQALVKDPRSVDAWTGKGIALQYREKYTEALACYDKALLLRPNHELASKWRQTCLRRMEGTMS